MPIPKIHIFCPLLDTPSGGGNQFLKALRAELRRQEQYAETPAEAGALLFNLSPFEIRDLLGQLRTIKKNFPSLPIIARLDGPIHAYRGSNDSKYIDFACHSFAEDLADGMIFQSEWSYQAHKDMGYAAPTRLTTIINAPDSELFFPKGRAHCPSQQVKIIATSWSPNMNKGFDFYSWLDQHLDFSKYSFTFVGNSPISFSNIQHLDPQPPEQLSQTLREHDIFITASLNDPCSNSLIEAMHSGLPVLARRSGGHPELVNGVGELFDSPEEIPPLLDALSKTHSKTQQTDQLISISEVTRKYLEFAQTVTDQPFLKKYTPFKIAKVYILVRGPYSPKRIIKFLRRIILSPFAKQ